MSTVFRATIKYNHKCLHNVSNFAYTICPGSRDPLYIVNYYIKWVTTSWTHGISLLHLSNKDRNSSVSIFQEAKIIYHKILISLQGPWSKVYTFIYVIKQCIYLVIYDTSYLKVSPIFHIIHEYFIYKIKFAFFPYHCMVQFVTVSFSQS